MDRSRLSVVVPTYNEERILPEMARRLARVLDDLDFRSFEVLLVDDGSDDRSEELIRDIVAGDHRFRGVLLSRNFGHQAAVSIGLEQATGSVVAVIDGDLQDPPEALAPMLEAIDGGAEVAYGVRASRKEGPLKRAAYAVFYRLLRGAATIDIPADTGDFCCMTRAVVDDMLALPERNRFVRGLRAWVGRRQVGVGYEREARFAGEPKYTLRKLIGLAYDGLFSFSVLPIRLMQIMGFVVSTASLAVALGYLVWYFLSPERFPSGFATLTISIWFLAGVQLFFLGIVGEYLARTFDESRRRPVAIVREIVAGDGSDAPVAD
jgi:dolichol-phosphate mannosyltransferase